ncbi:hypothetical protein MHI18_05120 [Peribacillus sp. FSL H8-0477]
MIGFSGPEDEELEDCPDCNGSGYDFGDGGQCDNCGGLGEV